MELVPFNTHYGERHHGSKDGGEVKPCDFRCPAPTPFRDKTETGLE